MSDETGKNFPAGSGPVSDRIRARIRDARKRFHANDNIAAFLEPGELDDLLEMVLAERAADAAIGEGELLKERDCPPTFLWVVWI